LCYKNRAKVDDEDADEVKKRIKSFNKK